MTFSFHINFTHPAVGQDNGKMFPRVPVTGEMWAGYKWMCTLIEWCTLLAMKCIVLRISPLNLYSTQSVGRIVFHTILVNVSQNIRYLKGGRIIICWRFWTAFRNLPNNLMCIEYSNFFSVCVEKDDIISNPELKATSTTVLWDCLYYEFNIVFSGMSLAQTGPDGNKRHTITDLLCNTNNQDNTMVMWGPQTGQTTQSRTSACIPNLDWPIEQGHLLQCYHFLCKFNIDFSQIRTFNLWYLCGQHFMMLL